MGLVNWLPCGHCRRLGCGVCWWGLGGRKTPHRIRPKTAESASPLGEGEEGRTQFWECVNAGRWGWAHEPGTPHRMPGTASASPLGEGEEGRLRAWVLARVVRHGPPTDSEPAHHERVGAARDEDWIPAEDAGDDGGCDGGAVLLRWQGRWGWQPPSPPDRGPGQAPSSSSRARVKRGDVGWEVDPAGWCWWRLGARGTPHRMPGTASASPLGEGEEWRTQLRECVNAGRCGWAHERGTPHRFRPKTTESASPLGEGGMGRPGLAGDGGARW